MSEHIDINAAFELSQNLADAARTAMQASHKLRELAEALQQATHGGWLPASVPPAEGVLVLGLYVSQEDTRFVRRASSRWRHRSGASVSDPDFWCHLPKGVAL